MIDGPTPEQVRAYEDWKAGRRWCAGGCGRPPTRRIGRWSWCDGCTPGSLGSWLRARLRRIGW